MHMKASTEQNSSDQTNDRVLVWGRGWNYVPEARRKHQNYGDTAIYFTIQQLLSYKVGLPLDKHVSNGRHGEQLTNPAFLGMAG